MAKNNLTPQQDILTRDFLMQVALADNVFDNHSASKKRLVGALYKLLNYQRLADGRFVDASKDVMYKFGQAPSYERFPCEFDTDYKAAEAKIEGYMNELQEELFTDNDSGSDEADSSESSEGTEVREAVLSKDV